MAKKPIKASKIDGAAHNEPYEKLSKKRAIARSSLSYLYR
jgi:hypothetical protein